nr:MAG TPA: hypothetical protein [Caudoviricetes sp.]
MKEKLAKLIDLKSIVTIIMTIALVYGFIASKIQADQFITLATMVFMFYFTKKKESE